MTDLSYTVERHKAPVPDTVRATILQDAGFGRFFTDHMAIMRYSDATGWHDPRIVPRRAIELDPAAAVLHYAQEIFEGMKAYRTKHGITLFRPLENARRFNASARRMAMPELPENLFLSAVRELLAVDGAWVPDAEGTSLYLRPFMIATEAFLGVRPAREYLFIVIASPAGDYFASKGEDRGGLRIWVTDEHTRAAPGGTGAAKCGGNYAGSLNAQALATRAGCDQVVFLDSVEHRWVEELGGMNIFFVFEGNRILTPRLDGTILSGITRDSLLTVARDLGWDAVEQPYSFSQWRADAASGALREVFACGTAAVVSGIAEVRYWDGSFLIGDGREGAVTRTLRDELIAIQRGRTGDRHNWLEVADARAVKGRGPNLP